MTVQEIQQIGFEKAVFGGYDMKSVDTFLERMVEEFSAMQKENMALKAKMKVLVDKIEEYRGMEDGMRRALMSAENLAKETVDKAKQEAEEIIAAAKNESESAKGRIDFEADKLEAARKQTLYFVKRVYEMYQAQAQSLLELAKSEKLSQMDDSQNGTGEPEEVDVLRDNLDEMRTVNTQSNPLQEDEPLEDATRKFDFSDIKFGSDYDPNA